VGTDFAKMRASLIATEGETRDASIEAAPAAFFSALEWRRERPDPQSFHFEHSSNQIHTTVEAGIPCWFAFETGYAAALVVRIGKGEILPTLQREVALREEALEFATRGGERECDEPAIRDLAAIHRAGFARELIWAAEHPTFWEQPPDLRMADYEKFLVTTLSGRPQIERIRASVHFTEGKPGADTGEEPVDEKTSPSP
jgi:hypothetical protein